MTFDAKKFGADMSAIVRDVVAREVAPYREQLATMERRLADAEARAPLQGEPGQPGLQGRGIAKAIVRTDGVLILTLTDGETLEAGTVAGVDGKDGAPGADAPPVQPEVIRGLVAEAVAAIPPPERGLQGEPGTDGAPGEPGRDGTSVTVDDLAPVIASAVALAVAELPPAEAGAPGRDGTDGAPGEPGRSVQPEEVRTMLEPLVREAVAAIPAAKDGAPGAPGADGRDGTSITPEDVQPLISAEVQRAVATIPVPKDGRDGTDGVDGLGVADLVIDLKGALLATFTDGRIKRLGRIVGTPGRDGSDGRDGKGFTGGLLDAQGHLHLTGDDGTTVDLGRVVGVDGKDGRDGTDGAPGTTFTLDDFHVEQLEDGRTIQLRFTKGEVSDEFQLRFPVVLDRGTWKERDYQQGDSVSWGGSTWIAQRDTTKADKPEASDAWRLSVKRGRDGKAGLDGKDAGHGNGG